MNTRLIQIVALLIITIVLVDAVILLVSYNSNRSTDLSQLLERYQSLLGNYTSLNQSFIESLNVIQQLRAALFNINSTYMSAMLSCNSTIANLTQRISQLESENSALRSNLSSFLQVSNELNTTKEMLLSLSANFTALSDAYRSLNQSYQQLLDSYEKLSINSSKLAESMSSIDSNLASISNMTKLRGSLTPYSSMFIDYNSPAIAQAVYSIFGNSRENPYVAMYKIYNYIKQTILYNFDTPYLVVSYNSSSSSFSYQELPFYLRSGTETLSLGIGDSKNEAILFASMLENFYLTYYGSAPQIYVVILNGTGLHGSRYYGFLLVLYGNGKASLLDPGGAQLLGQDFTELVQAEPTSIYSAVTSYISRINGSLGSWSSVLGMIGVNKVYFLNNTDITSFVSFLYSIGG
ncbi:MAG: hypothetical protein QW039_00010 [Fervidicoccaceae archaeon]